MMWSMTPTQRSSKVVATAPGSVLMRTCLFQQLRHSAGVSCKACHALVHHDEITYSTRGILQQTHTAGCSRYGDNGNCQCCLALEERAGAHITTLAKQLHAWRKAYVNSLHRSDIYRYYHYVQLTGSFLCSSLFRPPSNNSIGGMHL